MYEYEVLLTNEGGESVTKASSAEPDEDGMFVELVDLQDAEFEETWQFNKELNARSLSSTYDATEITMPRYMDVRDVQQSVGSRKGSSRHRDAIKDLSDLPTIGVRYLDTNARSDLDEDIDTGRDIIKEASDLHPQKPSRLVSLGTLLSERFSRAGAIADLDEAVFVVREAVDGAPKMSPNHARYLDCLAITLHTRFCVMGSTADLSDSIWAAEEATSIMIEDKSDYLAYRNTLAITLRSRYLRSGVTDDLNEVIRIRQEVISKTPEEHLRRPVYLTESGLELFYRYLLHKDETDLDDAIERAREAIRLAPSGVAAPVDQSYCLAFLLGEKYAVSNMATHLDEAIRVSQDVVDQVLEEDHNRASYLNMLGTMLHSRYKKKGAVVDLEEAILNHKRALAHAVSPAAVRITAGMKILEYSAVIADWQHAYEASEATIGLFPELLPWLINDSDKQHVLEPVIGFASDAAAAALHAGQTPSVALRLLEQGRALFATSVENLRPDMQELEEKHPELAEKFVYFAKEFDRPVLQNHFQDPQHKHLFWQSQNRRSFEASSGLRKVITHIRKLPDFEGFLKCPSAERLQSAARDGPIVLVNVSSYRCDAIMVELHRIRSLHLQAMDVEWLRQKVLRKNVVSPVILGWLWDVLAEPTLNALGFSQAPFQNAWPRVWWIPTGILTQIPIHAAGHHVGGSSETVLDRVISSYATSVKSILNSHRHETPNLLSNDAVLIAMEETPGYSSLPSAGREVATIRDLCKEMGLNPLEPRHVFGNVLSAMARCRLFHFAGHGFTDARDPSKSCLVLGSEPSRLSISSVRKMNIGNRQPFLAFLSACGTARVRNSSFVDEGIHLISGYQLMGFRHVIGTLWEVDDGLCAEVAKVTYEVMRDGALGDVSVSLGLHKATRELRDRSLHGLQGYRSRGGDITGVEMPLAGGHMSDTVSHDKVQTTEKWRDIGESDSENEADEQKGCWEWVPYVHFGV
ncbi:CHAT domain-containing protein [Truncatella angustata]|uniref:CHAT domain-containing protein n=1 Tax=Truncatella angustata TaxID=152316 RepID=A0A9P8U9E7_9PEZI|nr:CHAT domain-containing protein [Truncatella angustata]KAH6646219.1 CHAT domain-containing protein [Truncatella angustata]